MRELEGVYVFSFLINEKAIAAIHSAYYEHICYKAEQCGFTISPAIVGRKLSKKAFSLNTTQKLRKIKKRRQRNFEIELNVGTRLHCLLFWSIS